MGVRYRRLRRMASLCVLLLFAAGGGLAWLAYFYMTDSETLAALIREQAPRFLPTSAVRVGRVQNSLLGGKIILDQVLVQQKVDDRYIDTCKIRWMEIKHDPNALMHGKFVPQSINISFPTLRLKKRKDGTWNLQGLLADPWPLPDLDNPPPVNILNGTLELSEGDGEASAVLKEVAITVKPIDEDTLEFDGRARSTTFETVRVQGRFDRSTGTVTLSGDLNRLVFSDILRGQLPADIRASLNEAGLTGGEVDVALHSASFNLNRPAESLRYKVGMRLGAGVWDCPRLPFALNNVLAKLTLEDGQAVIHEFNGVNGSTKVEGRGRLALGDPEHAPLNIEMTVRQLMLDQRLKAWTPPEFADIWKEYSPTGQISVGMRAVRERPGGPVGVGMSIICENVGMNFHLFKYPLSNIQGPMTLENDVLTIGAPGHDLHTMVGGKPLRARGTITHPGPDAIANLHFEAEALPIDNVLLDAMPEDVRKAVQKFSPTGSVRGGATLVRLPPEKPTDPPEGIITIDADLELNERCSITWADLPYPVTNLTGRLAIHPDHWIFSDMKGNGGGVSVIQGSGEVRKVGVAEDGADILDVDLKIDAKALPFDEQLRKSLPQAWQKVWATLDPTGTSDVETEIKIKPGQEDLYKLRIRPGPQSVVRLGFDRDPSPGDPGGHFVVRMDDVSGQFVSINGTVDMSDVGFNYNGSPVHFERGRVRVEDSGKFDLNVWKMNVENLQLNAKLQSIMPPVMAQFARKLNNGKPFNIPKGNMHLGWSGQPGAPVHCSWNEVLIILMDNTLETGIPLRSLQGQLEDVSGGFDGQALQIQGLLNLDSVMIEKQQVTRLRAPLVVKDGLARLGHVHDVAGAEPMQELRASLLGGEIAGGVEVSLEESPRYRARFQVNGARLESYAHTVPGTQTYRGLVSGELDLTGQGADMRSMKGSAYVHVTEANLGELPALVQMLKLSQLRKSSSKAAFHEAEVRINAQEGVANLSGIRLNGNPFSFVGSGKIDSQGSLSLMLDPAYGGDRRKLPFENAMRVAGSQLFRIHVKGTLANPRFDGVALPAAATAIQSIGQRSAEKAAAKRQ